MIQSSLFLDKSERTFFLRFNRLLSFMMENGKVFIKIMGFKIPFLTPNQRIYIPKKLIYLNKGYSFLRQWRLKKIALEVSFSDPMMNGITYGIMKAVEAIKGEQRVEININFLGKNRLKAEFVISYWEFIRNLVSFLFPLLIEMRRGFKKGGK